MDMQKTIDDYCHRIVYRFGLPEERCGVAKEPWKQIVHFNINNGIGGYGIILGREGFILTSKKISDQIVQNFDEVYVSTGERRRLTLDTNFYQAEGRLGILKTEHPVEEAARVGLDSHVFHQWADYLIVPGDTELNDLTWRGVHSIRGEIVSSVQEAKTLFHAYSHHVPYVENEEIIIYDSIEKIAGSYFHHQGKRLFPMDFAGPLESTLNGNKTAFEYPFFTGLILRESEIGIPVFVRDTVDYDAPSDTPENEQQPKLYLVGILDSGLVLKDNLTEGYVTPVSQVARAGSKEIKNILKPTARPFTMPTSRKTK